MSRKIINLKLEKIRRQLKRFEKTGYIDERLSISTVNYAGESFYKIIYQLKNTLATRRLHNRVLDKINLENEWEKILNNLETNKSKFKYPTILSRYRKGINPILAIHQEYQRILLTDANDYISIWILNIVKNNYDKIMYALSKDIECIEKFKYKVNNSRFGAKRDFSPQIFLLLRRLKWAKEELKSFKI